MLDGGAARRRSRSSRSTSYTVGRVRREFANQSSVGVMVTATKRQPDRRRCGSCPTARSPAASTAICALQEALQPHRLLGRQPRQRRCPRRSNGSSRTAATISSGPTRPPSRSTRRARRSAGPAARSASARSAASASASTRTFGFKSPGLRHQRRSGSSAAPTSSTIGNWLQIRSDDAEPLVPQPEHQLQPVRRRGTPTAIGSYSGGNVNAHCDVHQQLERRRRRQLQRARLRRSR